MTCFDVYNSEPDDVGQVTTPEWGDTFFGEGTLGAVKDASVWTVQTALLDHLILILDQELNTLNWGGSGLKIWLFFLNFRKSLKFSLIRALKCIFF